VFFRFVTKHACDGQTDGQTDGQNYDPHERDSIGASRGKNGRDSGLVKHLKDFGVLYYYYHYFIWISYESAKIA